MLVELPVDVKVLADEFTGALTMKAFGGHPNHIKVSIEVSYSQVKLKVWNPFDKKWYAMDLEEYLGRQKET